jgi:hypothetical protein
LPYNFYTILSSKPSKNIKKILRGHTFECDDDDDDVQKVMILLSKQQLKEFMAAGIH